jgi:hypothetical protein
MVQQCHLEEKRNSEHEAVVFTFILKRRRCRIQDNGNDLEEEGGDGFVD